MQDEHAPAARRSQPDSINSTGHAPRKILFPQCVLRLASQQTSPNVTVSYCRLLSLFRVIVNSVGLGF